MVERIGEDRQPGPPDEFVRQRRRRGAGIDQHRARVGHHPRGLAGDRSLAVGVLLAALLDRGLHHAAPRRPAVNHVEVAGIGEQLQIAADGLVRNAENRREFADAHGAGGAQALHDLVMAANGERSNHVGRTRIRAL